MKFFCVGIKGSGMSTLAEILYDLGNEVSGYDDNQNHAYTEDNLIKRNIKIYYNQNHDLAKDTIVTYSKAFKDTHPELIKLRALGLPFIEYNQLLGILTSLFETTCVAGTHGKTTTSLLISNILKETIGCNYFVGDGSGFASKDNHLFVIESCEYKKNFLAYHPANTIITNIELEHVECYDGIADIRNTFATLANRSTRLVIACGDDENIRLLDFIPPTIYYGFKEDNDLYATNISLTAKGSHYDVYFHHQFYGTFDLPLFGRHMILNSLATIALCDSYHIEPKTMQTIFQNFVSPKRRFKETILGDNVIIDDYAHHPTEIRVTLEAARQKYPDKTLVAIFKPNTYSRTIALKDDFIKSLKLADQVFVTPIDCNRETQAEYPGVTSEIITSAIPNSALITMDSLNQLLPYHDACLVFMSCANIYTMEDEYKKLVK